ncbi:uncharacterized protein LOC124556026 [Schistocerca americana]|uniref:uncharacterized protein LOC124556026 n=1 Tax=Schistocerca americana TaxID=7009 RepID=UPI001F5006FD|nr:uncharacterized protein LOC124556026 [Schistocerca americana]
MSEPAVDKSKRNSGLTEVKSRLFIKLLLLQLKLEQSANMTHSLYQPEETNWLFTYSAVDLNEIDSSTCKSGFVITVINTAPKPKREVLSEEEQGKRLKEDIAKYENFMKNSEMLQRNNDSKRFLKDHP